MHGGGQTRHSWAAATVELGRRGYHAVSLDLRGHGESDWAPGGSYALTDYRDDVYALLKIFAAPPVMVGASLGGMTALAAIAESEEPIACGLVLVDIAPRIELDGARRIQAFMAANLDGFETIEQVADAIAAYNPHRPRPEKTTGLMKNLRERDGRLYWHWDPAMLAHSKIDNPGLWDRLDRATAAITVPTMLIKGAESELVSHQNVEHMRALMPHADYVDISGAGHMVAGDRNDAFNSAVFDFLALHGL